MRKRVPVVLGGGVALLVASQFFDFGLGFTDGDGPADSAAETELASIEDAITDVDSIQPNLTSKPSDEETEQLASEPMEFVPASLTQPNVVDVLIDGNQYLVAVNADDLDQREAKTLDEIIAMTANASGEENGIRVRLARTPDAIAASEAAILTRLGEAGLTDDEIDSRRQLVE